MTIEVDTIEAPARWASYLINGDASGFEYYNTPNDKAGDRDKAECDAWLEELAGNGWSVVSTEDDEPWIGRRRGLQTEMLTYTLHGFR